MVATVGLFVLSVVVFSDSVASACSWGWPPTIQEVAADADVVGIFEQEHIAEAPALVFVSSRAVSVVNRYWGTPPPNVGLALHGEGSGILGVGSCGNLAGHLGLVRYGGVSQSVVDAPPSAYTRRLPRINIGSEDNRDVINFDGRLSVDQEAVLTARFGPPVTVEVSRWERIGGTLFVWRHHLAIAPALLVPLGLVVSRRRLWRLPGEYRFNWWVVGPAAIGMMLVTWLVSHIGAESWLGMAIGFAVAAGVAWLSRSAVALFAAGLAADWLLAAAFDTRSSAASYQIAGVVLFVMGAGALAWSHGHWSRWPASFAVVAGWVLLLTSWDISIYLRATLTTALAVAMAWWAWNQRDTVPVPRLEESQERHRASLDR